LPWLRSPISIRAADRLANREVRIIQAWVRRMMIDVDSNATKEEKEQQLLDKIRLHMERLYREAAAPGTEPEAA
jgi:hypothetical protein